MDALVDIVDVGTGQPYLGGQSYQRVSSYVSLYLSLLPLIVWTCSLEAFKGDVAAFQSNMNTVIYIRRRYNAESTTRYMLFEMGHVPDFIYTRPSYLAFATL